MDLKVDPEFKAKIPRLADEELALLEENILSDGEIRDPIVIWNGIILDGHNRFEIWQKHPEIPYKTHNINLPDRNAAIIWICKNQLGRRNLTLNQRKYLIGKQYEAEKASRGLNSKTQNRDDHGRFHRSAQNEHNGEFCNERTRERVARENNTTSSYVQRAEKFAEGVDAAEEVIPGTRDVILAGSINPSEKAVMDIATADQGKRRRLVELLREPRGSAKETLLENDEDIEEEQSDLKTCSKPTKKEILAVSEGMLHSKGVAAATGDDIIYEMRNALEDMIWRWNNVGEIYSGLLQKKEVQKSARGLATKGITFLREIKKGVLWNEKG